MLLDMEYLKVRSLNMTLLLVVLNKTTFLRLFENKPKMNQFNKIISKSSFYYFCIIPSNTRAIVYTFGQ